MMQKCVVCDSQDVVLKTHLSREDKEIELLHCQNCHHAFQPPENYVDIYSNGEFTQIARDNQQKTPSAEKIKQLDAKALKRVFFYKKYLQNDFDNVLEIGSSIGSFVSNLKLMGKQAEGLEPNYDYANFSKHQYNIEQHCNTIENFQPDHTYDAFCSFYVLEHTSNPQGFMEHISRLANPNAKLLFEMPSMEIHGYGDMKSTIWGPHFQYFKASSLYTLVSKHFKVIDISYYGSSLFVYAVKSGQSSYSKKEFKKYKNLAKRVEWAVKFLPKYRIKNKISISQLCLQPFLQREVLQSFQKAIKFGKYAIKERLYVNKERNKKGELPFSHLTYYRGWENTGDTVLSKCVRDVFNNHKSINWNLNKVTAPVSTTLIESINKTKALIIGGGGLFLPDTNQNAKSGWQWAADKAQVDAVKPPIILYAVGYNYFKGQSPSPFFIDNLNHIIRKASFVGLRNMGSIAKVKELIAPELSDKVVFQPCPTTIIRNIVDGIPNKVTSKNIGVNIAYDRYERRFGGQMHLILDKIASALKKLDEAGFNIINVCHLNSDAKFELNLDKNGVNYKTVFLNYLLPQEVYRFYNGIELMMGMRGHAQMIPFGLNCRILTLGTHDKMRWFLEDINASDWYVNLRENPEMLDQIIVEKSMSILNDKSIPTKLLSEQERLFSITQRNYEKIISQI